MNILSTSLGRDADDLSIEIINRIVEAAGDDDLLKLKLLAENAAITKAHKERVETARDEAARRLRDAGVPMIDIADTAGVTDSYLSRRLISKGASRRKALSKRRRGLR